MTTEKDLREKKRALRRNILNMRDSLSQTERMRASLLLTERILGHQWFYRSEVLLGFVDYGSEISTREILQEALKMGKKVYLPKIVTRTLDSSMDSQANVTTETVAAEHAVSVRTEMRFYRIESLSELEEGYKGILEPNGESEEYIYQPESAESTLMLMPGVVFDVLRNRIGYGKGFYDRYLSDKEELQIRTIGVGYKCQLVEEIPAEENDIKPYQVICV